MELVKILGIICVTISSILHGSLGEVRLVCPRPQSPKSNVLEGPCDPAGLNGESYVTDVSPGPLTVRWEETFYRMGSPSRIAIKSRSLNTTCVLLDHIPHNDNQFSTKGALCDLDDYPIGRCLRSKTEITVMIPDIQCDDCYLQLISVDVTSLTLGNSTACIHDDDDTLDNCPIYHSCSSIKIWPTPSGEGRSLGSCLPYPENLDGKWPYVLTTTFGTPPNIASQFFVRDVVELKGQTVTFDVQPIDLDISDVVNGTVGVYDVPTGLIARVFPRPASGLLIFQGTTELPEEFLRTRLLSGGLGIGLRSVSQGLIIFPLQVISKRFVKDEYATQSAEYSSRGLLRPGRGEFTDSSYITPFRQSGPCALETRNFNAAVMWNSGQGTVAGLVALSSVEYSAFVVGVFTRNPNTSMNLFLTTSSDQPSGAVNQVIPGQFISSDNTTFKVNGVVDLENFFVLSEGAMPDTVMAQIRSPSSNETLMGKIMSGIFAPVHDEGGELTGLLSLNLLDRTTLAAKLMLVNFPDVPGLGGLFGPALPGRIGSELSLPTSNVSVRSVGTDAWMLSANIGIESVKSLRHFWEGLLYIDINRNSSTPPRGITAQLTHLIDFEVCGDSISAACFIAQLRRDGSSPGGSTVPSSAFVAFLPGDNGEVAFSIVVRDLQPGENVTSIRVTNEATGQVQVVTPILTASLTRSNAVEGEGSFVLPLTGELRMSVFTSLSPETPFGETVPNLNPQSTSTQAQTTTPATTTTAATAATPTQPFGQPSRELPFITTTRSSQQSGVSTDDFTLSCGSLESGPMAVSLAKGALNMNMVYVAGYSQTCSFVQTATSWVLRNARDGTLCGVKQSSGANWQTYEVTVIVQMQPLIETGADIQVSLTCNFTGAAANSAGIVVTSGIDVIRKDPNSVYQEVIFGRVDQTYRLRIHNGTELFRTIDSAVLGDSIALVIQMSGRDEDEQSLRVRQCKAADSRGNEVIFLDNYCPVMRSVLKTDSGFNTFGGRTVLSGLEAFRMKDSPNDRVTFSCIVEPCSSVDQCNGDNCVGAARRRRRQSTEEQKTTLRLASSYRVVDVWETPVNGESVPQTGGPLEGTQFPLLITVSVISCLLLITVVICISVYCQLRRLKQNPKSIS